MHGFSRKWKKNQKIQGETLLFLVLVLPLLSAETLSLKFHCFFFIFCDHRARFEAIFYVLKLQQNQVFKPIKKPMCMYPKTDEFLDNISLSVWNDSGVISSFD